MSDSKAEEVEPTTSSATNEEPTTRDANMTDMEVKDEGTGISAEEHSGKGQVGEDQVESKKSTRDDTTESPENERKGRNGFNSKDYRNGKDGHMKVKRENLAKFDPSAVPISSDPGKIRAQVEFYFGDSNLPKDNFLWGETDGQTNKPVPITTIHKFGRMTRFQPYEAIVEALRDSHFLEVSGSEGHEAVSRKVAYDPNKPESPKLPRTIYAKGFGDEQPTTQFDVEAFFAAYGPTNEVRLRRHMDNKLFKGSVFVEFADEETAKKFLALDPKPTFQGKELKIMSKVDYCAEKNQMINDGDLDPSESKPYHQRNGGRGRGNFRGQNKRGDHGRDRRDRDHGDRDPDDWKRRRDEDQKSGFRDSRGGRGRRNYSHGNRDNERKRDRAGDDRESGKKRVREDSDEGEAPMKKVDTKEDVKAKAEES